MTTATKEGSLLYQTTYDTSNLGEKPKITTYILDEEIKSESAVTPNDSIWVQKVHEGKPVGPPTLDQRRYYDDTPNDGWDGSLRMLREKIEKQEEVVRTEQANLEALLALVPKIERNIQKINEQAVAE